MKLEDQRVRKLEHKSVGGSESQSIKIEISEGQRVKELEYYDIKG